MFASSWLRQLQRRWFGRHAIRRAPVRRVRPRLEVLEDRTAPAVLTVNSLLDSATVNNVLTLREALQVVNSGSTAGLSTQQLAQINQTQPLGTKDTIIFDPSLTAGGPATINLGIDGDDTFGPSALLVSKAVSILGPSGGNGLTLARDTTAAPDRLRLFYVASSGSLTLQNLTLSGGLAQGGSSATGGGAAGLGGAVVNAGSLTLLDDTVTGNQALGGSSHAPLGSVFGGGGLGGNAPGAFMGGPPGVAAEGDPGGFGGGGGAPHGAGGFGGGGGGGGGTGGFGGGGGDSPGESESALQAGGFGGGSGSIGGGGGGAGMGGGIFNYGGTLTITNSTLTGNTAQGGSGVRDVVVVASGFGGAIFNLNGTVTVTYSTLASNVATTSGGAIYNLGDNGVATQAGPTLPHTTATVSLFDSILAGSNTSDFVTNTTASGTQTTSGNDNLIQTDPGNFAGSGTLTGNPLLSALGNYGGPTETLALLPGSPALDAGTSSGAPSTDQRGVSRPQGSAPDLGAFESQGFTLAVTSGNNQSTLVNSAFANPLVVTVTPVHSGDPVAGGQITFTTPGSGASATLSPAKTVTIASNGTATVNAKANSSAGSYQVTANTAGALASTAFQLTNNPASTTTTASNATATFSESTQNVTLNATVSSDAGAVNAGTVTFTVKQGSTTIGTATTSTTVSNGLASVTYVLPAGTAANTYTIDAVYNPGTDFTTSEDTTHTLTVSPASTTTMASNATATFSTTAQNVMLTANVTSDAGAVNEGTVTFTILQGSTTIGTATTSTTVSNGQASVSYALPASLAPGSYTIDAVYNPGADFTTSADTTHALAIRATTTIAASNATVDFSTSAQDVTLSAQVGSGAGAVNEGTVTFTLLQGNTVIGTATTSTTVSNGQASVSYVLPAGTPAGRYTIEAVYNPGSDFITSADTTHTLTIRTVATTIAAGNITVSVSGNMPEVTLTARVSSSAGAVNEGTVTFLLMRGRIVVGRATTSTTVQDGQASVTYVLPHGLRQGRYTIVAVYNPGPDFIGSRDNKHTLTVIFPDDPSSGAPDDGI